MKVYDAKIVLKYRKKWHENMNIILNVIRILISIESISSLDNNILRSIDVSWVRLLWTDVFVGGGVL
jgi:hypothetical protein